MTRFHHITRNRRMSKQFESGSGCWCSLNDQRYSTVLSWISNGTSIEQLQNYPRNVMWIRYLIWWAEFSQAAIRSQLNV
jgi:hypothetical protein